jgi:hypothetical protein
MCTNVLGDAYELLIVAAAAAAAAAAAVIVLLLLLLLLLCFFSVFPLVNEQYRTLLQAFLLSSDKGFAAFAAFAAKFRELWINVNILYIY